MNVDLWWQNFLTNLNLWAAIGLAGQGLFAARWFWQWIASERQRTSVVPPIFWYLSLAGSVLVTISGVLKAEIVILMAGLPGLFIYTRNVMLLRERREA